MSNKALIILMTLIIATLVNFLFFNFCFAAEVKAGTSLPTTKAVLEKVGGDEGAGYDTNIGGNLPLIAGTIINAFLSILGIVFLAYIIHGGYIWMIARGEEELVTRAKDIIKRAIIGLLVVISAWAITEFVLKRVLGI